MQRHLASFAEFHQVIVGWAVARTGLDPVAEYQSELFAAIAGTALQVAVDRCGPGPERELRPYRTASSTSSPGEPHQHSSDINGPSDFRSRGRTRRPVSQARIGLTDADLDQIAAMAAEPSSGLVVRGHPLYTAIGRHHTPAPRAARRSTTAQTR